jgi:hypothetical protein
MESEVKMKGTKKRMGKASRRGLPQRLDDREVMPDYLWMLQNMPIWFAAEKLL